jgi:quinol monooxygenase YgiN
MAGTVIIPWYATGLRADGLEEALNELAASAMRYGAISYAIYRARDDRYKFQQLAVFDDHADWERYWEGPEMIDFRTRYQGWFQVPLLYGWWDETARGSLDRSAVRLGRLEGNGRGNGHGAGLPEGESA